MRLSSIFAHVLASTAVIACGGQTLGDPIGGNSSSGASGSSGASSSSGASGGTSSSGSTPPSPPPKPPTPPVEDAGCVADPVLVSKSDTCSDIWFHKCGVPAGVDPSDGMNNEECRKVCGPSTAGGKQYYGCNAYLQDDLPGPSFECWTCIEGRRPQGYVDGPMAATVAGWLAHAADLERVSIDAFQILRRELAHHGAPSELLDRVAMAEADEVRHAHVMGTLARRAGAMVSSTPVRHEPVRPLLAIALENAVEGCIRETYGAIVAAYQAEHAERLDFRRVMKQIHRDETEHAELAWSVHAWLVERLDDSERAAVLAAMRAAVDELSASARCAPSLDALGLPPPREAVHMVQGLDAMLWGPSRGALAA